MIADLFIWAVFFFLGWQCCDHAQLETQWRARDANQTASARPQGTQKRGGGLADEKPPQAKS